jgi:hypothetical protein
MAGLVCCRDTNLCKIMMSHHILCVFWSESGLFVFDRGIVGPGEQPSQLQTVLLRDCQRLKEVYLVSTYLMTD